MRRSRGRSCPAKTLVFLEAACRDTAATACLPGSVTSAQLSGPGRSTQVARRLRDAALKRDKRRIAFRMRCGRGQQATTGPDHAARQHEVVVQREGFNSHAVGILVFAGWAHPQSATAEGGDAIEEGPVVI